MAKLNLAQQFKKSLDDISTFDQHPFQGVEDEEKINYLKKLCPMIHADQQKHKDETAYFGRLYRTIDPKGITLDELLAFSEDPDLEECLNPFSECLEGRDSYGISLLMDMTMLATADGAISDDERALISAYRNLFEWGYSTLSSWYACCETVATAEEGSNLNRAIKSLPTLVTAHAMQYREIKYSPSSLSFADWNTAEIKSWDLRELSDLRTFMDELPPDHIATKVKLVFDTSLMLSTHPLVEANLEDKMNYLKALSLVMVADGQIHPAEKIFFGTITRTLIGDGALEGLLAYATEPDFSDVPAMKATVAKNERYKHSLLLDAAMLAHSDGDFANDEFEMITQFQELFDWNSEQLEKNYKLLCKMAFAPEGMRLNLLFTSMPEGLADHILEFRGIKGEIISNLASIFGIKFTKVKEMDYGSLTNASKVCTKCVTVQQFSLYLQFLLDFDEAKLKDDKLIFNSGEEIVSLSQNGLIITDNVVSFTEENAANPVMSVSPLGGSLYCKWLSSFSEDEFAMPKIMLSGSSNTVSLFTKNSDAFIVKRGKSYYLHPKIERNSSSYDLGTKIIFGSIRTREKRTCTLGKTVHKNNIVPNTGILIVKANKSDAKEDSISKRINEWLPVGKLLLNTVKEIKAEKIKNG